MENFLKIRPPSRKSAPGVMNVLKFVLKFFLKKNPLQIKNSLISLLFALTANGGIFFFFSYLTTVITLLFSFLEKFSGMSNRAKKN